MDALLTFAKGPLFAITFSFMIFGLLRHVGLQMFQLRESLRRASDKRVNLARQIRQMAKWLIPVNQLYRQRPFISVTSFVFHVGLLLVPVFLAGHVDLWRKLLGFGWPALWPVVADVLTLITIVAAVALVGVRILEPTARALTSPMDQFLLLALLAPFVSGFMAFHPAVNPLSYQSMMLTHALSAELVFVLVPTTKLAHCVLFPFDRLSAEVFWKMPAGAGSHVARELHGEGARV